MTVKHRQWMSVTLVALFEGTYLAVNLFRASYAWVNDVVQLRL